MWADRLINIRIPALLSATYNWLPHAATYTTVTLDLLHQLCNFPLIHSAMRALIISRTEGVGQICTRKRGKKKKKKLYQRIYFWVYVCMGRHTALQKDTGPNTQKTDSERRGVPQTDRETSKGRQGEPQTHSRQMEEPESPRAALWWRQWGPQPKESMLCSDCDEEKDGVVG